MAPRNRIPPGYPKRGIQALPGQVVAVTPYGRGGLFMQVPSELSLGSVFQVPPSEGGVDLQRFGNRIRILDINGDDRFGETLVVCIQNEATLQSNSITLPGPVTGIVEFGNGSGFVTAEFDIPAAVIGPGGQGSLAGVGSITPPYRSNFVMLSLPASSVRIFARNDARIGPLTNFNGTSLGTNFLPADIRAHVAYGGAFVNRQTVVRTYHLSAGADPLPVSPAAGSSINVGIPPFARSVRFPRNPLGTTALRVAFVSYFPNLGSVATYVIPVLDVSEIPIPTDARSITVINDGPSAADRLDAEFILGF